MGGKGKEKKVEESYLIEKLVNDKIINGVWKIEVKWKGLHYRTICQQNIHTYLDK